MRAATHNQDKACGPAGNVGRGTAAVESHRRCIASGLSRPRDELLRFVVAPDRSIVLDLAGKLPGRGLWCSPQRDMLEKARARNLFAKAARAAVRVEDDLVSRVEGLLRSRSLELLGLARRAGQAVAGFEKVRSRLSGGQVALLIQARDAAEDGRARLAALGRGVSVELRQIELFDAAELGGVFGRSAAVHVAVAPGGLAERIASQCSHLAGIAGVNDRPMT